MKQLRYELSIATQEHVSELVHELEAASAVARMVADGGDLYPSAVRDFCGRLAEMTETRAAAVAGLMGTAAVRVGKPVQPEAPHPAA